MWGEVPFPEDLELEKDVLVSPSLVGDDEDFAADEASGGELAKGMANHKPQRQLHLIQWSLVFILLLLISSHIKKRKCLFWNHKGTFRI